MENKTTSELLDIIGKYDVKDKNEKDISDKETDQYVEALDELITREPFKSILGKNYYSEKEENESLAERISNSEENFEDFEKKIKRHKHDEKSGDVMIRM